MTLTLWILKIAGAVIFVIGCVWLRQLLSKEVVIAILLILLGLSIQFIATPSKRSDVPTA